MNPVCSWFKAGKFVEEMLQKLFGKFLSFWEDFWEIYFALSIWQNSYLVSIFSFHNSFYKGEIDNNLNNLKSYKFTTTMECV